MAGNIRRLLSLAVLLTALSSVIFAQSENLAEQSNQARELMASGRYDDAIPIYRALVKAVPGNAGLITNLGLAFHMAGHEQEAVAELTNALKLEPKDIPAHLYLGYAYLSLGEPAKAIPHLEIAVRADPSDGASRGNLAEALFAVKKFPEAAAQFEKLSQSDPGNPQVWYRLGICYQELSQESFDDLQRTATGSSYWLALVADSRAKAMQLSSAFYLYRQAIARNPKMRGVHAALAAVYEKSGHSDWAKTEQQREAKLGKPNCAFEKYECALSAGNYRELAALTGKTPEIYYWKTRAYQKLAIDAMGHLGQLPPSPQLHELLAKIQTDERQFPGAVQEWQKAYELSGKDADVGTQLVVALFQVQNFTGARQLLEALLQQRPKSAELNYLYGFTLLSLKQPGDAAHYLELSLQIDPRLLPAHSSLAQAYLAIGESKQAIPHLKAALPIDRDGSIHYQLARAYQSSGQSELARTMLQQYQQIHNARQAEQQTLQQEVQITAPGPG
ncbi:MAG: tetratricopeptide repeat protein [Acidobacteria bacterium]|nr:MAG: tetratricopeptide repeat protein [Acidobacteriota bacterium]